MLPDFFAYYFKNSEIDLGSLTNNSGVKHINLTVLSNIEISVPDLTTQEKIVAEVSEMEAKIAELQTQMAGAEEKKKAVLAHFLK